MGRIDAETCSVCTKCASKYRCPACGIPYCSLECNKVHKSTDASNGKPSCSGKRGLQETTDEEKIERQANLGGDKRPRTESAPDETERSIASEPATCVRMGRDQWRGGREDLEEEEWRMSSDQQARIAGCAWLKAALRDPKLQNLLTEIDKADDREKALSFHRTSKQFGDFMDKLLLEIEEYQRGGPDEPELVAADP